MTGKGVLKGRGHELDGEEVAVRRQHLWHRGLKLCFCGSKLKASEGVEAFLCSSSVGGIPF